MNCLILRTQRQLYLSSVHIMSKTRHKLLSAVVTIYKFFRQKFDKTQKIMRCTPVFMPIFVQISGAFSRHFFGQFQAVFFNRYYPKIPHNKAVLQDNNHRRNHPKITLFFCINFCPENLPEKLPKITPNLR